MTHQLSDNGECRPSRKRGNSCPPQRDWHLARPRSRAKHVGVGMTMVGILAVAILAVLPANTVHAQTESHDGSWVIWPGGALAFPTGRFGEKDEESSPAKDGHKIGFEGGLEAGYFLSEFACVGVGYNYSNFDLDLAGAGGRDGSTSIHTVQAWARYFLAGGYRHWRPYIFAAAGLGRPKAAIDYDPPVNFGLPADVEKLESTVAMTSSISGGIGVLIPATRSLAVSFEPRYISVQSKGTGRTDLFTMTDGEPAEVKEDPEGNRLKAKSNTNWWELRIGLIFMIK